MGGCGSGGKNKYCRSVKKYERYKLDSYTFYDWLAGDKYLWCKESVTYCKGNLQIEYYPKDRTAYISDGIYTDELQLEFVDIQKTMTRRLYFHCPTCGRRCRNIYAIKDEWFKCRICGKLHYESQQTSGTERILYKMRYILKQQFGWSDFDLCNVSELYLPPELLEKPRYMRWSKYEYYKEKLLELQEEAEKIWFKRMFRYGGREAVRDLDIDLEKYIDLGK